MSAEVVGLRPAHLVPANLTDYQRMMFAASAYLTVPCPFCGAPYGAQCTSKRNGHQTWTHAKRKAAVAHLSEDEKVAAFAALKAEQDRRRREVEADMARQNADPVYVARRDAIRKHVNDLFEEAAEQSRERGRRCEDALYAHADGCRCKLTGEVEYTPKFARTRREHEHRESLRGTLPVTDLAARRGGAR